jgi:hypothetical protein
VAGVDVYLHEQGVDSAVSNGLPKFDVVTMMALHLHQNRRDRILRGQAAAWSMSVRFGRPPIARPRWRKPGSHWLTERVCGKRRGSRAFRRHR